jgi:transposase
MAPTTYKACNYDVFIGIDVDKKSFSFTTTDRDVMISRSKTIPANEDNLYRYITNSFPEKTVLCGYEAGPTGFHLYDYLIQKGVSCIVMPPSSIPKPPDSRVKTNRIDSERIANCLRSGEARAVRVPDESYRDLRQLIVSREQCACDMRSAKQRIKALLLYTHIDCPIKDSWSAACIARLKKLEVPGATRQRLDLLLEDLAYSRQKMARILRSLKAFSSTHKEIDRYRGYLETIPGIGLQTALTILARIGDPKGLTNVQELGSFFGLVPSERSTGERVQRGPITHLGNNAARTLLIEAAWVAIRYDKELKEFYHRIHSRHHPSCAAKKAIVAVARKLTMRIYSVLTEERPYTVR